MSLGFFRKKADTCTGENQVVDHSLKNIYGYSPIKKQMIRLTESDGLCSRSEDGKVIDRRTKILYSDKKYAGSLSYTFLCQITASMPSKYKTAGSAFGISTEHSVNYVMTCAHNVTAWSSYNGRFMNYDSLYIYRMRQGENSWKVCSSLDEKQLTIHPKYDGHPDSGYDIALCRKLEVQSKNKNTDSFRDLETNNDTVWVPCIPSTIKKGMSLEIAGYPGEKEGYPYTHTGKVFAVTTTASGSYLLWYDIDCTMGNCGSPIMVTDTDWIKQNVNDSGITKAIIGVHTGNDLIVGLNYGTLITPPLFKWITETSMTK